MSETKAKPDLTGMTFREIAAKYGEEAAIHAGIAADPEWGPEEMDMSKARPAAEVLPDLVARYEREQAERRKRGRAEGSDQGAYQPPAGRRPGGVLPQ